MQLVLDWDGTVTEVDTLHMVIERFGDLDVFHAAEEEIGRSLTLREVIALEMTTVTAPLDEVVDWLLATVRVRPGFAELVRAVRPADRLRRLLRAHRARAPARTVSTPACVANRIEAHADRLGRLVPARARLRRVRRAVQAPCGGRHWCLRLRR